MQAVLDHPFTRACPLVQQCLEEDLQRLQDYHSGLRPSADSGVRCQQRRLVLPACTATGQPARSASTADAALPGSAASTAQGSLPSQPTGSSGSKEAQASTIACRATAGAPSTGQTAGTESSSSLQQQGNLSSSVSRGPSGWLHRSGSSGSGKPSSSWRSYRRRVTPSCKELMYVCDGDRNGVIHYIATGETRRCGVSDMPCYGTPVLLESETLLPIQANHTVKTPHPVLLNCCCALCCAVLHFVVGPVCGGTAYAHCVHRVWQQALGQPCAVKGPRDQGQQPILTLHRP